MGIGRGREEGGDATTCMLLTVYALSFFLNLL